MEKMRGRAVRKVTLHIWDSDRKGVQYDDHDEIIVYLPECLPIFRRTNANIFHREILDTLAHESRHACQDKNSNKGRDIVFRGLFWGAIGAFIIGDLVLLGQLGWQYLVSIHGLTSGLAHCARLLLIVVIRVAVWIVLLGLGYFLHSRCSWQELDAVAFARVIRHQPEWQGLLTVTRIPPPQIREILSRPIKVVN